MSKKKEKFSFKKILFNHHWNFDKGSMKHSTDNTKNYWAEIDPRCV